jgi:hypothetical protein
MDNIDYSKNICLRGADRASRCCRKSGIAWADGFAHCQSRRLPRRQGVRRLHYPSVVLDVLNNPRFANCAPAAIHAQLLDEGRYLASVRTMYRLLQIQRLQVTAQHGFVILKAALHPLIETRQSFVALSRSSVPPLS